MSWEYMIATTKLFQSTRPLRGATMASLAFSEQLPISIHAPLAGRDYLKIANVPERDISIHAPLAGRDPLSV